MLFRYESLLRIEQPFRLKQFGIAPEIAAVMLRRQQASAIISAREKIVEGAVSMVKMGDFIPDISIPIFHTLISELSQIYQQIFIAIKRHISHQT